jgi:hypothetical protein
MGIHGYFKIKHNTAHYYVTDSWYMFYSINRGAESEKV